MKTQIALVLIATLLCSCDESHHDHKERTSTAKPLDPGFPPPMYSFTPRPIKAPNLVLAPRSAPVFNVPDGTTLISRSKNVTSSDPNPIIGNLGWITDGDKANNVQLLLGLQWVQIDLERNSSIQAIWIWHYYEDMRVINDVIVCVSDDPKFITGVTTLFNNDYDNSSKLGKGSDNPYVESHFGKVVDGKGTRGRYVRLYCNGNSTQEFNDYTEVEVYGNAS